MTIGIYRLIFKGTDKVYIGQQVNIKNRYSEHLRTFKEGSASCKLQDAYNLYGVPSLDILCECAMTELDSLENEAIELFDSANNGFNTFTHEGGSIRSSGGLDHWNQKYPKRLILKVLVALIRYKDLSYAAISHRINVSQYLVHNIATGKHHLWLKDTYPDKFALMLELKIGKKNRTKKTISTESGSTPILVSPLGDMYNVPNIRQFCIEHPDFSHNVDASRSSLGKVIKGTKESHKGWTLLKQV